MLRIIIAILTVFLMVGMASADIQLAWDENDPVPDGYRLFQRLAADANYDYTAPIYEDTEITATATGLTQDVMYCWVVRAFVGSNESGDSNEVCAADEGPGVTIIVPLRPGNLRVVRE